MLLSLILLVAQPAAASEPPAIYAATVADAIRPRVPQRFSPDIAMVAAAAEQDLLVLTFEVPETVLADATPEAISNRFSYGFCTAPGGRELLEGPMSLRIDARTAGGRSIQGAVLETCPPAPRRAAD